MGTEQVFAYMSIKATTILIACIAPVLFFIAYFYFKDKYSREPVSHIVIVFALGVISAPLSILVFDALSYISVYHNIGYVYFMPRLDKFIITLTVIAPIEELSKFIPLWIFNKKTHFIKEPVDAIIFSSICALGFAMIENWYFMIDINSIDIARAVTLPFNHVLFSSFWGYALSYESNGKKTSYKKILLGLLLAIAYHGIYDFILFDTSISNLVVLPMVFLLWFWLSSTINRLLKKSPFKPPKIRTPKS